MKYHKLTENAAKPAGFWGRLMIRSMNRGHSALTDWALDYVPVENGFRVLDIGCGGRLLLVFEMLRTEDNPDRWKPVEERLHIKAVSCAEIRDILLRAGYQNIRTHTKSGTSWLCATAEKE